MVRSNIGIIAQDPTLLSGTLRLNLDIEGTHSDEELCAALIQVQLINPNIVCSSNSGTSSPTLVELSEDSHQATAEGDCSGMFGNLNHEIKQGGEKYVL